MDYREQYQRYVAMVEETIEQVLPQTEEECPNEECPNEMRIPKRLCEAMRYSLLAGASGFARCCCWRRAKCWAAISVRRACRPPRWK